MRNAIGRLLAVTIIGIVLFAIVLVAIVYGGNAINSVLASRTTGPVAAAPTPTAAPYNPAPATATAVPAPAQPPTGGGVATTGCTVINDYGLDLKPELATSGSFVHVEFYSRDGEPERETILPSKEVPGGRFIVTMPLKGHVWEYSAGCTFGQTRAQVDAHINRRLAGGANNAGYVEWLSTGFFRPAVSGQIVINSSGAQSVQGCLPAEEKTLASPTDLAVKGPAIVHPWWNNGKPSFGQTQTRVKVNSGELATFAQMMGKAYVYQDVQACQANLDKELASASFPVKTLAELRGEGLILR